MITLTRVSGESSVYLRDCRMNDSLLLKAVWKLISFYKFQRVNKRLTCFFGRNKSINIESVSALAFDLLNRE